MNRLRTFAVLGLLAVVLSCPAAAEAQEKCPVPTAITASGSPNIFTPEQEIDLGDIEAERVERNARVIHDDELSEHMNLIVSRIVAQMPPTQLNFRVMLVDLPSINAFSLPGGRIYVTRKMVAFLRNDDELAGLLGHEMGHAISHQGAIDLARMLRDVIGVTSVGDKKDISDKFNRFLDNAARNHKVLEQGNSEEEPHQVQADRIGLYALASAGYSPTAQSDLFDRTAQTKGKSGGWISDFFGETTPNEKRLREMRKSIDDMPAACRNRTATAPSQEFLIWQADVIAYSGLGRKEILSGVLEKKILDPPLRSDVTNLKFSPDGKYILAQDDSSIFVLSRDPLRLLFRMDAPESHAAQFTPDSQSVVFDTRGMRVEEWTIADGERTSVHELAIPGACVQTLLSPDGKTIACVSGQFDLSLYDVAQANLLFSKKAYFAPDRFDVWTLLFDLMIARERGVDLEWVHMAFSPDAKFFLGANPTATVAVSLTSHEQISLHGSLTDMIRGGFAFLSPDTVIAVNRSDPKNSAIFEFPSGDAKKRLLLGGDRLAGATRGNYLVVGPVGENPTNVLDLSSSKFVFASKDEYAADLYDQTLVVQARNGEIALLAVGTNNVEAHITIPISPLGRLFAGAVSSDLKWIALSGGTRGAVWNLPTSKRLYYTRSFHGASFDGDAALFADYPKLDKQERSMARLDLAGGSVKLIAPIDDHSAARQWGLLLVSRKAEGKGGLYRNVTFEVRDARGGNTLWTRTFPKEVPSITPFASAGTLLIAWPVEEEAAKDELKSHPALQARIAAIQDRKNAWLLEDLDARTGVEKGALVIDTGHGSFSIERAYAVGDWVVAVDTDGRTLIYSLSDGEQKGAIFGTQSILSPSAGMLAIENEPGRVDLFGMPSLEKRGELAFSSPVALWSFSDDGKRLLILTKDQTVYTFDPSRITLGVGGTTVSADSSSPAR